MRWLWLILGFTAATGEEVWQPDGSTRLHTAAYEDDVGLAAELLKGGLRADAANRYGITPLLLACENGSVEMVEMLLKAGADPRSERAGGETALMVASRTGKVGAVRALLAAGADVNHRTSGKQTALMWASAEGHADVIRELVEHGAQVSDRLGSGFTAILFAAREGQIEAVKRLIELGADAGDAIDAQEKVSGRDAPQGTSAMHLAVENGHFELALELVRRGADPNDQRNGFTVLHTLTWVRKPPHGDDEAGQPPPDTHGRVDSLEFVRRLVRAGARVNVELGRDAKSGAATSLSFHGATPFLLACRNADLSLMKCLVEMGADAHKTNARGSTPLMAAAGLRCHAPGEEAGSEDECLAACQYLLSLGADVNAVDKDGQTAMHGAAYKSLPKVAEWLAANGAKIEVWNQKNSNGWTPLLIAQGFRMGNFKPSVPTIEAIEKIMLVKGVKPPPAPDRDAIPKKKGYLPK
jgi:uncharacterized protein